MERGHYEVAKAYILYREKRSALRRVRHTIARTVGDDSLDEVLRRIQMDFTEEIYLAALQMKFESFCRPGMTEDERAEALTKAAVELTTAEGGVHRGAASEPPFAVATHRNGGARHRRPLWQASLSDG